MSYYDRAGEPVGMYQWVRLSELGESYRRIAETHYGPFWISTVWLGLDHDFSGTGPPLIFETMIFATDEEGAINWDGEWVTRWPTEDVAREGHRQVVGFLRLSRPLPALPPADRRRTSAP